MDPEELWHAWAAGFVDGEGAIMITRSSQEQIYVNVKVSQKTRAPLDRLALMYGGSIREERQGAIFVWSIYSRSALEALRKMRPYMMVKGAHADLVEEFFAGGDRIELHERMHAMQTKGANRHGKVVA
jgi:hypothetical protein